VTKGDKDFPQAPKAREPKMSSKTMEVLGFTNPRLTEHHKTERSERET
jgi:hypothetical protein